MIKIARVYQKLVLNKTLYIYVNKTCAPCLFVIQLVQQFNLTLPLPLRGIFY